jgi:NADPH:quinone reductase-like Zn-dependent oxidoreductase
MLKSIRNIGSVVTDLAAITGKEATYQLTKASEKSDSITQKLADKAALLRNEYEKKLAMRKAGVRVVNDVDQRSIIKLPSNK